MKKFLFKLSILFFLSLLLFIIALEFYNPFSSRLDNPLINTTIKYTNKFIPELPKQINVRYNNIGFLGDDFYDSIKGTKIFFVGSSTTQSIYIEYEKSWVGQLMEGQNIWYNNAGIDGANIDKLTELIYRLKTIKPNYIVVLVDPFDSSNFNYEVTNSSLLKNFLEKTNFFKSVLYPTYASFTDKEIGHRKVDWDKLSKNKRPEESYEISEHYKEFVLQKIKLLIFSINKISATPIIISSPTPFGKYTDNNIDISKVENSYSKDLFYNHFNQILKEFCKKNSINYINGYDLPKSINYFYDYTHFNIYGSKKFADYIRNDFNSMLPFNNR